jgi:flagella basal body P-ring formation protein FlgA
LVREKKFRRGDIVKAMMKEGTWEISLHAIAQEDGVVGKMVKLKSMSSKKLLVGMVNSLGEVEIK